MGGFSIVKTALLQGFKQFFPPACPLCSKILSSKCPTTFCSDCLTGFSPLPVSHCLQCSLPFNGTANSSHLCGRCIKHPPPYVKVYAVGLYERTLKHAIQQFKFNHKVGLDRSLGLLLAHSIDDDLHADLVVPIPLHRKRLQHRSYNQALLLAREVSRVRKMPVGGDILRKIVDTRSQQGLSAKEREQNLRGAFELNGDVKEKIILLIDDVMTTGTTVSVCSKILAAGGAQAIYVAVIGRAG